MPETRRTQADRRARSRDALLEATARGISRVGYAHLVLDAVAADAGYTRGALYHQFRDKEELVLATLAWVRETWNAEVGVVFDEGLAPVATLAEMARRHAVYCRRDIAGVMAALRVEFAAREHPIGDAVRATGTELVHMVRDVVLAGRQDGSVPPGLPAIAIANAALAAVEGATIALAGRRDAGLIAQQIVLGLVRPQDA